MGEKVYSAFTQGNSLKSESPVGNLGKQHVGFTSEP